MAQIEHNWQRDPAIAQTVDGASESGGTSFLRTKSPSAEDLLSEILIELKKLNLRQEEVFEQSIDDGDIL